MASGRRGVPIGHVFPGRAGPQHPEDAVEHLASVAPWTPSTVRSFVGWGNQGFEDCPLLVLEIHNYLLAHRPWCRQEKV
jgi:hypothetical protein